MSVASKDSNLIHSKMEGITGIVLAGGKSARYGKNKALEEIHGVRLIERVIRIIQSEFERLIIITNAPHEYDYLQLPMYEDLVKGLGPVGGVYTGLEAMSDESGFFFACDMPFLQRALVRHMVDIRGGFDAVVPKVDWKIEPLHAIYAKTCLPAIKELIDSQDYQIRKSFDRINVRFLEEEEIRTYDPELRSFLNVNRPEELIDASKLKR